MEIRLWLPDTLSGWKYCLRHPRCFVIGRYGFKKFIKQRDIMFAALKKSQDAEDKYNKTLGLLIEARKELSTLKKRGSHDEN